MTYYNQNKYGHVPYPRPSDKKATVKSGGCGVCCGCVILSYYKKYYPPEVLAPIFIQKGARADSGTNMRLACNIVAELAGVQVTTSSTESELVKCLRAGGVAIANVDGDAGEKGVFSNEGHYIVVVGVKDNGDLMIYDVGDYASKYTSAYRAKFVKREGELLVCSQATLDMDTKHRSPNYYLFWPNEEDEDMTLDTFMKLMGEYRDTLRDNDSAAWSNEARQWGINQKLIVGSDPKDPNYMWEDFLTREQAVQLFYRFAQLMGKA